MWSSIHHEAKTGQKTMGNEAWLILLAHGHKQSEGIKDEGNIIPVNPLPAAWAEVVHHETKNVKFLHTWAQNTQTCRWFHTERFKLCIYHLSHGIYRSPSVFLSFFLSFLCLWAKAEHKALSLRDPYGTKLAFWTFCIYACHADNEAFICAANISKLERQGWGMKSGKAVTDTGC